MKFLLIFVLFLKGVLMASQIDFITHDGAKVPIVFEQADKLPIFNLQLVFTNSGYIQDGKLPGITTMVSNILHEGTKKDGGTKFAKLLENKAISLDISHGFETFVLEINSLKTEKQYAISLLNKLLKDPNITNDTIKKLQKQQLSRVAQKQFDFDFVASSGLKKMMFKNTPLEHSSIGDEKSIKKIDKKSIQNHIKKLFNLNNLIVVGGGDITLKEFKDIIKPLLENFNRYAKTNSKYIKPSTQAKEQSIKKDTKQAYIYFGSSYNMRYDDKDSYKAKVASFILGGSGFGSRLMEEIRVKRGLAYSIYSHTVLNKTNSYFTGYMQTQLKNEKKAKKLIVKIIDDFIKNGVTKDELKTAKEFLKGSSALKYETFSQKQRRAFDLYYKGFSQDYDKKQLEKIDNLTISELNSFIAKRDEIRELFFFIVTK